MAPILSAAFEISPKGMEAAETMIAIETNPPKIIEMIVSFLANDKSSLLCHLSLTKEACKNKLYGTTVVPIRPIIINKLWSGNVGINIPFNIAKRSGFVTIAVIKKEILIIKTKVMSAFSKNL